MGSLDRGARIILASIFAILHFTGIVTGVAGTILLVLAVVFILTSLIAFCPLYPIFGISTCPKEQN